MRVNLRRQRGLNHLNLTMNSDRHIYEFPVVLCFFLPVCPVLMV